jgi:heme-degrading monooxygenase HmoA
MYARITRVQAPPERIGELVTAFKEQGLPALRALSGYAGSSLAIDPTSGDGQAVSFWDSREAMQASRQAATSIRTSTVEQGGGTVTAVKEYEQAIFERVSPPATPAYLRVTRLSVPGDSIDGLIRDMRDDALPTVRGLAGFRALTVGVARETGECVIVSVWDTAEHRDASEPTIEQLRTRIFGAAGGTNVDVAKYEVKTVEFVGVAAATAG